MLANVTASEQISVLDSVVGTASSTALKGGGWDLSDKKFRKIMFIVTFLAPNDSEDQTVEIVKCSAADQTGAVVIKTPITSGETYTLVAGATANDGKIVVVDADEVLLDGETTLTYIACRVKSSSSGGGTVCITMLGINPAYGPTFSANALNSGAAYRDRDDNDDNVVMIMR